jgi:tetratricopeptide (TPR) repeat protein
MTGTFRIALCVAAVIIHSSSSGANDLLSRADQLYASGPLESVKEAAALYARALEADPKNYEAAWKAARSYREYAQRSKEQNLPDWEARSKQFGKLGMSFGEKAIALEPDAIEGHFWYGCSVGNYSDGVSIATALREGLKSKTQSGLESAYRIDKHYRDGGPMKALGRFWFVLPWPFANKQLAMRHLKEFQQHYPEDAEGQVFLAEALIDKKQTAEARSLLEKAAGSDRTYYAKWAKRLLTEL